MNHITTTQQIAITDASTQCSAMSTGADLGHTESVEQIYHEQMVALRQRYTSAFSSDSKKPFALKQRLIERPMLEWSVSQAQSGSAWRKVIVDALLENVKNGPGHFSVHRAKEALKQIASSIGMTKLASMLESSDATEMDQAAHLLGWLKNPRAAMPLLAACERRHPHSKQILAILATHYIDYSHSIVAGGFDVMS